MVYSNNVYCLNIVELNEKSIKPDMQKVTNTCKLNDSQPKSCRSNHNKE